MKNKTLIMPLVWGTAVLSGCSPKVTPAQENTVVTSRPVANTSFPKVQRNNGQVAALPSVLIYKMRGDYANLVPVTLDEQGGIASYPDPADITESQAPVALGDGWYLDRRGISTRTAFTDFTYAQYHAMEKAPSVETLKAHIIDAQGITAIYDCGKKKLTTDEYKQLVKGGFAGCTQIK